MPRNDFDWESMDYITVMRGKAREAFERLHEGVGSLTYTDFPDHSNVGDAAIALGQAAYWHRQGIDVVRTYSVETLSSGILSSQHPVAIQGGGNFGGLYPAHSEHRYVLAENLPRDTLLIQEPQSIHFVSRDARDEFARRMAPRDRLRIAVRDTASLDAITDVVPDALLSPDAVHHLGYLDSDAPTESAVFLLREDKESAVAPRAGSVDWPGPTIPARAAARIRKRGVLGVPSRRFNKSSGGWFNDAARRLEVGVAILSKGETIVTDRLHAMLLGLQLGRRVIAIENSNGKLGNYAATWFTDVKPDLTFVERVEDAHDLLA